MKKLLYSTDLIIECRDNRIPITSKNPLLDRELAGKRRIIVYTRRDLCSRGERDDIARSHLLMEWDHPNPIVFMQDDVTKHRKICTRNLLNKIREIAQERDALTPMSVLLVGMPNVGKSTVTNHLKHFGNPKNKASRVRKVAITGGMPGVTRSISETIKIIQGEEESQTVYLRDTPGVFVPYVPDQDSMLKLALCGFVKESIVSPIILADYLLYKLNKVDPTIYRHECYPTNDILELLDRLARKLGRLQAGGKPDLSSAADWFIRAWRMGTRGKFLLDDLTTDTLRQKREQDENPIISPTQAYKLNKAELKLKKAQAMAAP